MKDAAQWKLFEQEFSSIDKIFVIVYFQKAGRWWNIFSMMETFALGGCDDDDRWWWRSINYHREFFHRRAAAKKITDVLSRNVFLMTEAGHSTFRDENEDFSKHCVCSRKNMRLSSFRNVDRRRIVCSRKRIAGSGRRSGCVVSSPAIQRPADNACYGRFFAFSRPSESRSATRLIAMPPKGEF